MDMSEESENRIRQWIDDGDVQYDPDRWDPDEEPIECQVCGTDLQGAGDGYTMSEYCPECRKHVWIR